MTAIRIDTGAIRVATTRMAAMNTVNTVLSAIEVARSLASPIYRVSGGLGGSFGESTRLIMEIQSNVDALTRTVTTIAESYEAAEDALTKRNSKNIWPTVKSVLSGTPLKVSGAVAAGSVTTGGVTASGSIFGGEASLSKQGKWDLGKGDAYLGKGDAYTGVKGKVEGWVARGTVSADYGLAHGKLDAKVGDVSAEGEFRASILKDGKLAPGIVLKGKAGATALSGEAEGRFGADYFDTHGKAEGKLGTASAEGSLRFDKDGFSAGAKAEAYAATGKVSGGFTLFGIKIDAELEGKAGGAGVGFGAEATDSSVSGRIDAGLGAGAGVKIKIDWSGVGDFVNDAGAAMGELGAAFDGMAQGVSSLFSGVGAGKLWSW